MNKQYNFDSIRPYNDKEVQSVLLRLLNDKKFINTLAHYQFPFLAKLLGCIIKPMITYRLSKEIVDIYSVETVQEKFKPYITSIIKKATDGVTFSGLQHLKPECAYLFITNHRDIVMDSALVNYAVHLFKLSTPRIAIGDNLLQTQFISDLMRLNKGFIVYRSLNKRKEKLTAFKTLSNYINYSIRQDNHSVWIAQAEGRSKDGNDRTEIAILKMLHMSFKNESFTEMVDALHFIPVSISYEYDPCDIVKAKELYIRATTGKYQKKSGEDYISIALGITGYKGRVHINFGSEVKGNFNTAIELANELDKQILYNYRLFPINYIAYESSPIKDKNLSIIPAKDIFCSQEIKKATKEFNKRKNQCKLEYQNLLTLQYANPVINYYYIKKNNKNL